MLTNECSQRDCEELSRLDFRKGTYVFAVDQASQAVVLYDLDRDESNLEACEIWELILPDAEARCISCAKYRENTVYGNVVIVAASYGLAAVYRFPSGEKVWSCPCCGYNPHSIEILPNGAIVTASSTDGLLHVYDSSKQGDEGLCQELTLPGAHAALWDPDEQLFWSVGGELISYTFEPNGMGGTLQREGKPIPVVRGHEFTSDYSDPNRFYFAGDEAAYAFDKKTRTFSEFPPEINHAFIKGFGTDLRGNTAYCYSNGGPDTYWENSTFASWCTDRLYLYNHSTKTKKTYISTKRAFYRIFVACGTY